MEQPGELTRPEPAVTRPCLECYTTSFAPDLVYADGSTATMADEPMLHHAVLSSQWRSDATCSDSWLGLAGERFFASGNERTKALMPTGYGYRVRSPSRAGTSSGCTANTSRLTPPTTSWASCSPTSIGNELPKRLLVASGRPAPSTRAQGHRCRERSRTRRSYTSV